MPDKDKGKIITNENEDVVTVGFATYWHYFSKYYGFWFFVTLSLVMAMLLCSRVGFDYMIGLWANSSPED